MLWWVAKKLLLAFYILVIKFPFTNTFKGKTIRKYLWIYLNMLLEMFATKRCYWKHEKRKSALLSLLIKQLAVMFNSVQVWDRRCFVAKDKPAGVLMGHLEGVTFIDSRGGGRYFISNGKDQTIKLWDTRKMSSNTSWYDYFMASHVTPRSCNLLRYSKWNCSIA